MNPCKRVNLQTMKDTILTFLRSGRDLSGIEAAAMFRCRDLPKRVSELRCDGHVIEASRKLDATGQRYTRYKLGEAK